MSRPTTTTTTLATALAALALAMPGWAQAQGTGRPPVDPGVREMQREHAQSGAMSHVAAQERDAAAADAATMQTARELLAEARGFLTRRNMGRAIEALERAETRLLTNSVVASEAGRPQGSAALSQIAAARRLAGQGDARSALNALEQAEAALPASPSGPGARPLPPGVPTGVDAQPAVPPSAQPPRPLRQGPRPAVPPGPGMPAEQLPPRG